MVTNFRKIFLLTVISLSCFAANAQKKKKDKDKGKEIAGAPAVVAPKPAPKKGPKPYDEVITKKAVTTRGMITVHEVEDKFYFEVPANLMNTDILVLNRVSKSSIESPKAFNGYAGDQINESVIRFEMGPNDKLFIRKISYSVNPDSAKPMYKSVMNSNIQPIALAFDIASNADYGKGTGVVVDVTSVLNSDNEVFGFDQSAKASFQAGTFQADKSYVSNIRSYPTNTEIKTVKTYGKTPGRTIPGAPPAPPSQSTVTLELNSSMIRLPERPMKPRIEDSRVGYFGINYTDFDVNPQGVKEIGYIAKWRLEPKPGDMEKYKRGELVEPMKQIVYYIDPATPAKWVQPLIDGVNDWNIAFERAGFKNAIVGKRAPTYAEDSTWSMEDARHSGVIYKPSSVENAYGPSTVDPRTGEILESHIGWFHNVMKLLHDWYMVQAAAIDPRARKMNFDDALMSDLIRFVSSHEVGHTLGLPHNFGSSAAVPVEKLRDKAWVEANGHTPSIMDYARFNYVAQPEDNITTAGIYPRIGEYDKWSIEWGYRLIPEAATALAEVPILDKWIDAKAGNPVYYYGRQGQPDDPRDQSEAIGDNPMLASTYGIKNLQRIVPNLPTWTKEENEGFGSLSGMYDQVVSQFRRYIGHVGYNFGGVYENFKKTNQKGDVYSFVSRATQKEAAEFMNKQVFTTPTWLVNKDIMYKTGKNMAVIILSLQESALGRMLSTNTMNKMLVAENAIGTQAYTVNDLLYDLKTGVFGEVSAKTPIESYRRNLQKAYVERLGNLINPPKSAGPIFFFGGGTPSLDVSKSDILSYLKGHAKELKSSMDAAALASSDKITKYHLQDLSGRLKDILDPK